VPLVIVGLVVGTFAWFAIVDTISGGDA